MEKVNTIRYLFFIFLIQMQAMIGNAQYHKQLRKMAENNHLIGMSVAVVQNGKVKDIYHYGYSDLERKVKVNDSTLFRIASISKTVTTTALMKLYERKLFQLDDDISKYLGFKVVNPNFPDKAITFRMLLTHTSSLLDGDAYDKFLMVSYKSNTPPALKSLLVEGGEFYDKKIWNNKEPGTFFTYCNLNFGITGTLVEKLSGQRFDIFVKNEILKPLGIHGSFNTADIENINNLSALYRHSEAQADNMKGIAPKQRDLSAYKTGENGIIYGPQGGLRISAADLCKFMTMQMNDGIYGNTRILDSSTVEMLHSGQWKFNGSNGDNYNNLFNEWGLGFQLISGKKGGDVVFEGEKLCGHSGDAYGLVSSMFFDKKKQFGFVFITNGYSCEKEFTNAENSAFYKPEADVFKLIEKHFYKKLKDN